MRPPASPAHDVDDPSGVRFWYHEECFRCGICREPAVHSAEDPVFAGRDGTPFHSWCHAFRVPGSHVCCMCAGDTTRVRHRASNC